MSRRLVASKAKVVASNRAAPVGAIDPALIRSALISFAALALMSACAGAAFAGPTPCTTSGSTATCQGNQSAGVASGTDFLTPPVDTLNVNSLTQNIAPASGVAGINFTNNAGGNVTVNSNTGAFQIITTGANADGLTANSTNAVGNSGAVAVTSTGNISTQGDGSQGIDAQSNAAGVGGIAGQVAVTSSGNITTAGNSSVGIQARSNAIGVGGIAGQVSVTSAGNITTAGNNSAGIVAQNFATNVGGIAGQVTVTSAGNITTTGNSSTGISTLSSGSSAAGPVTVTSAGNITVGSGTGINAQSSTGVGGTAGAVTVTSAGNITVGTGNGINAQSSVGAGGNSGAVTVTSSGTITATGLNASGIVTFSTNSLATVNILGGTVTGGSGVGAGVRLVGIATSTSTLNNFGTITTVSGLTGTAVLGFPGNETINNSGTIIGNVDLDGGVNAFNNQATGLFNMGPSIFLGAGNTLTNAGTLAPGGAGVVQTSALTGNLVQTGTGKFQVDLDLAAETADRLNVTGPAALAGTVVVGAVSLPGPLTQQATILSAAGGTTNNGLGLLASPALNATLSFPNATDVVLGVTVDFSTGGLNQNQTNIGDHLNASLAAGGGGLGPALLGLLNTFGLDSYRNALDQLSPEIYGDLQIAALYSSLEFSNNLMSCRVNGTETAAIVREGQCVWVGAKARFLDSDSTREQIGFDETAGLFAAGAQFALDPVWRLGFGIGYQTSVLETSSGAESDGDQVQGGVALKYNPGPLLLAAAFTGGRGWYDTTRPMNFGGFSATAEGDAEIDLLAGRLHGSYVFGAPSLYFKPLVDLNVTQVDLGDVNELRGNGAGLIVAGRDETVFSVSPALEVGTEWWFANGTLVRPFLRAGATWFDSDNFTVAASFDGTPDGVAPFLIRTGFDDVQADVAAGIDMINKDDAALRLGYDGHFGEQIEIHSIGFKGSAKF